MSHYNVDLNLRPKFDQELVDIAQYVLEYPITSEEAFHTARLCLMDSLGCAFLALRHPECNKLLGPIIPGTLNPQEFGFQERSFNWILFRLLLILELLLDG